MHQHGWGQSASFPGGIREAGTASEVQFAMVQHLRELSTIDAAIADLSEKRIPILAALFFLGKFALANIYVIWCPQQVHNNKLILYLQMKNNIGC